MVDLVSMYIPISALFQKCVMPGVFVRILPSCVPSDFSKTLIFEFSILFLLQNMPSNLLASTT